MKIEANGIRLNVRDQGRGTPALVFLHYWGGSSRTWEEVIRLLPHCRSVAIDFRGWGESDAPESGYAIADLAESARSPTRRIVRSRTDLVFSVAIISGVARRTGTCSATKHIGTSRNCAATTCHAIDIANADLAGFVLRQICAIGVRIAAAIRPLYQPLQSIMG